jgi:exodeoxyribonuclease VII large subunit
MNEIYTITALSEKLKLSIPSNKFKIIGEVNQPKISQGNLYLNLKDEKTIIKTIIWKNSLYKYNNKINDGDKIIVYGHIDFYGGNGIISLIVDEIIENEGMGDLQKKYELLKEDYKNKGYFINKLNIPIKINKILILTSKTGAAIHDFLFNLENNKSKISYDIIDVPVQGIDSPKIISTKLNEIKNNNMNYDLIIITRGGGSFQDLFGFSDPLIIETVYNFKKIPIISAIGHQVDVTLLDLVADYSCPTPSLAAQYLVDINKNYIEKLYNSKYKLKDNIIQNLHNYEKKLLLLLNNKLKDSFREIYKIKTNLSNNILTNLNNNKLKLEHFIKLLDNPNIELYDLDYKRIENNNQIIKDSILLLKWNNQEYKIKII